MSDQLNTCCTNNKNKLWLNQEKFFDLNKFFSKSLKSVLIWGKYIFRHFYFWILRQGNLVTTWTIFELKASNERIYDTNTINKKLNSNPYYYKLKFNLTFKQKYNSRFEEIETVRTLKIQKTSKFGPKTLPMINDYEKPTRKEERKKKATYQRQKRTKESKRRKEFWQIAFFLLSSFFVGVSESLIIGSSFGPNLHVFCILRVRMVLNFWNFELYNKYTPILCQRKFSAKLIPEPNFAKTFHFSSSFYGDKSLKYFHSAVVKARISKASTIINRVRARAAELIGAALRGKW